jgi:excisionase family DNA binding protein
MTNDEGKHEELMKPGEVAVLYAVDAKTVTRWAQAGKLSSIRTPGNQRRFKRAEVMALIENSKQGEW